MDNTKLTQGTLEDKTHQAIHKMEAMNIPCPTNCDMFSQINSPLFLFEEQDNKLILKDDHNEPN